MTFSDKWVLDSGATHHMVANPSAYSDFSPYEGNDVAFIGDGTPLKIMHIGVVVIESQLSRIERGVMCAQY